MATRSPSFPNTELSEAIKLVKVIYDKEHNSPMDREAAVRAMGYSSLNGASASKLGALSGFGLLAGRDGDIRVSNDAIAIIAGERSDDQRERIEALQRCLRANATFEYLAANYESASVDNIASYLIKTGFKLNTANIAARIFRGSVGFVKEVMSAYNGACETPPSVDEVPNVGDFVQWESEGMLQFTQPKRVRALREGDGQQWVFVDGIETGLRVEEVTVEQRPNEQVPLQPPVLPFESSTADQGGVEFNHSGNLSKKPSTA